MRIKGFYFDMYKNLVKHKMLFEYHKNAAIITGLPYSGKSNFIEAFNICTSKISGLNVKLETSAYSIHVGDYNYYYTYDLIDKRVNFESLYHIPSDDFIFKRKYLLNDMTEKYTYGKTAKGWKKKAFEKATGANELYLTKTAQIQGSIFEKIVSALWNYEWINKYCGLGQVDHSNFDNIVDIMKFIDNTILNISFNDITLNYDFEHNFNGIKTTNNEYSEPSTNFKLFKFLLNYNKQITNNGIIFSDMLASVHPSIINKLVEKLPSVQLVLTSNYDSGFDKGIQIIKL